MPRPDGAARARGRRRRSRARPSARRRAAVSQPARSCSTPRCRATRRSSPTRRTRGRSSRFTYPHIGNYGVNADDDESRAPVLPRRDRPRPRAPPVATGARRTSLDDFLARHRRRRASPASTPGASPATSATPARSPARSAPPTRPTLLAAAQAERRHRRPRPRRRRSRTTEPYTVGADDAPFRVVAYDFGIKRTILASSVDAGCHGRGRARVDAGRRRARPRARRRVPLERPRRPGGRRRTRADNIAGAARRGAGVRHLPRPPDPRRSRSARATFKLPFGHHGGNHPGAPPRDRPGRDHQPEPQLRRRRRRAARRRRVTHVNLNDGVVEGIRVPDVPAFSVQYHPEAGPGPHDARYLFDEFTDLMTGEARLMPRRDDLETILLIGSGPIVIGQACEFDYSGTQACRVLRDEGYRVVLVNSNPATIMTDPEFADAHLRRAARRPSAHADHRAGAARRAAADARRPDRAQPRDRARTKRGVLDDVRRRAHRRQRRGDPHRRGPPAVQGRR